MALHVILCDDHRMVREALGAYLAERSEVAAVSLAADADEAVQLARRGADVLVLDMRLGEDQTGLDVLEAFNNLNIRIPVLVIDGLDHLESVATAFNMGALGFCLKTASPDEMCQAILAVAAGRPSVPDTVLASLFAGVRRQRRRALESATALGKLTGRERDVLRYLADGLGRAAIAERMGLSSNTVRTHLLHLMQKIGVNSQLAAAARGRELFTTASPEVQSRLDEPTTGIKRPRDGRGPEPD